MEQSHRFVGVCTLDGSGTPAAVEEYVRRVERETQAFLGRLAAAGHDLTLATDAFVAEAAAHRRLTRRFLEGQRLLLRSAVTGAVSRAEPGRFAESAPIDLVVGRWDQAEADLQHLLDRWWAAERSSSVPVPAVTVPDGFDPAQDPDIMPMTVEGLLQHAGTDDLRALCARLLELLLPWVPELPPAPELPQTEAGPSESPIHEPDDDPFMRFWATSQPPAPRPKRWLALPAILTGFSVTMALSITLAWVG